MARSDCPEARFLCGKYLTGLEVVAYLVRQVNFDKEPAFSNDRPSVFMRGFLNPPLEERGQ